MKPTAAPGRAARTALLMGACACALAWLVHRNFGLNPGIFLDEWYYSKMARLQPLSEAVLPSWLYFWLFRASNLCGDGFLDCVRFGNALFFTAAAPFVYLTARTVTGTRPALLVALFALLAPLNLFTVFFMPESMYYFGACVLAWVALTRAGWGPWRHALALGAILGLMSLVKVHALFLLPAACLFLLYSAWAGGGARWAARGAGAMALAALALFAVKFGLGFALAGKAALNLFGPFYGASADKAAHHSLLAQVRPALTSLKGHLMALALLFPLPLAMLLHMLPGRAGRTPQARPLALLQAWTLLTLGAALGMTVLYTASIAGDGPGEGIRLHMRYYSFVFPLLFTVAAAGVGRAGGAAARISGVSLPDSGASVRDSSALVGDSGASGGVSAATARAGGAPARAWLVALALAALLLMALAALPGYSLRLSDGPTIAWVDLGNAAGRVLLGLDLLMLVLWASGSALAPLLFLGLALPLILVGANRAVGDYLAVLGQPNPADQAGLFARRTIPPSERGTVAIAATGVELFRAQFRLDARDAVLLDLPPGEPVAPYQMPVHNKWLLVVGKHALPPGVTAAAASADYQLVKLSPRAPPLAEASFAAPFGNGLIASAEGLSSPEDWGRWSSGKHVVLHLGMTLPRRFAVVLSASAFDVNTKLPFTMHAGASSASFRLGAAQGEVVLSFDTDGGVRTLVIDVPHPVAPSDVGPSLDDRTLGIALNRIEIGAQDEGALSAR